MATTSTTKPTPPPVQQKLLAKAAYTELVAVNFQIQPKYLVQHVPQGLELDSFNGDTYVSLVCMVMRKIGVMGIPISRGFVELSLRFYVRHPHDPETARELVSSRDMYRAQLPLGSWVLDSIRNTKR